MFAFRTHEGAHLLAAHRGWMVGGDQGPEGRRSPDPPPLLPVRPPPPRSKHQYLHCPLYSLFSLPSCICRTGLTLRHPVSPTRGRPSLSSVSCRPHVACLNSSSPSRVFAQTILAPLPAAQEPDSQLHPGVTRSQPSVFDLQTLGPHCASATRRVKRAKTRGLPADPQPRVKVLEERNSQCPPPPQQPRTPQCNKGHFLIT